MICIGSPYKWVNTTTTPWQIYSSPNVYPLSRSLNCDCGNSTRNHWTLNHYEVYAWKPKVVQSQEVGQRFSCHGSNLKSALVAATYKELMRELQGNHINDLLPMLWNMNVMRQKHSSFSHFYLVTCDWV